MKKEGKWAGCGLKKFGVIPFELVTEENVIDAVTMSEQTQPNRPARITFDLDASVKNLEASVESRIKTAQDE